MSTPIESPVHDEAIDVIEGTLADATIALPEDAHRIAIAVATGLIKHGLLLDPGTVDVARALALRVKAGRQKATDPEVLADYVERLTRDNATVR
jgi:hypothetical protein